MPDRHTHARLNGERMVGVDAAGVIAIALSIVGVPTRLWADLLAELDTRPASVTHLRVNQLDGLAAQSPMQIELRVDSADHIGEALGWLVESIDNVNEKHDAHERRLAGIYREAVGSLDRWFDTDARARRAYQDPTLN